MNDENRNDIINLQLGLQKTKERVDIIEQQIINIGEKTILPLLKEATDSINKQENIEAVLKKHIKWHKIPEDEDLDYQKNWILQLSQLNQQLKQLEKGSGSPSIGITATGFLNASNIKLPKIIEDGLKEIEKEKASIAGAFYTFKELKEKEDKIVKEIVDDLEKLPAPFTQIENGVYCKLVHQEEIFELIEKLKGRLKK